VLPLSQIVYTFMSSTWRDEIPLKSAIIAAVRHIVDMDIKEWAQSININRGLLYQAADGDGTRPARIALALVLRELPSKLWSNRSKKVRSRDDVAYLARIEHEVVEQEA